MPVLFTPWEASWEASSVCNTFDEYMQNAAKLKEDSKAYSFKQYETGALPMPYDFKQHETCALAMRQCASRKMKECTHATFFVLISVRVIRM